MTAHSEIPHFGQDKEPPLPLEDVLAFRDEVLVPSIDFLAKRPFVEEAQPRSTLEFEQTVVDGEKIRRIKVGAFIDLDYPEEATEGDGTRVCSIAISVETPVPSQTDVLIGRMVKENVEIPDQYDDQAVLCAWEASLFFFNLPDEPGSQPNARAHMEVQDLDGNALWDNGGDDIAEVSSRGITSSDLMIIQEVLLDSGVDFDIACPVVGAPGE